MADEFTEDEQAALEQMKEDAAPVVAQEEPKDEPDGVQAEERQEEVKPDDGAKEPAKAEDSKPPEGYVPHQAMHAERQMRKQLEAELAKYREAEAQKQQEQQAPQFVDPLIDPEGFRKYQDYQNGQTRQQVESFLKQQQEQQRLQAAAQEAVAMEQEFIKTTPDYNDAFRYLAENRMQELRAYGYSDEQVAMQLSQDARAAYEAGKRLGMNPAQLVYSQAQQRGYRPKAQQQAQEEAAKIEALNNAQRQTQGLGSGGAKSGGGLTIEMLAAMSEDEIGKIDPAEIARAMGG